MAKQCPSRSDFLRAFLKGNTLLGGVPDATIDGLIQKGHRRTFAKGDILYRRGEPGDSLMVILSGRVKIGNINADTREVVLCFLGAGDIVGEMAMLYSKQRTADTVALEQTEVFVIPGRDLLTALTANPQAMVEMGQMLCEKLRAASAMIEDSRLAMRGRVAKGLLRLAHQHGRRMRDGSIHIELTLTQDDLGKYLGLSRANVSRELGHLKDVNVIRIEATQVIITDEHGLAELADTPHAHN
ncbi:MAG: Crp/Fnr family transcriptional regulator [Hyphomicrobiaceae bacterium]|nr:Crp/Fnr family transcriptional regulator [Hyphomicrobiaceae bacterium]